MNPHDINDRIHVLPINDLLEHDESVFCICKPRIEQVDDNLVIVHNSFDGREEYE